MNLARGLRLVALAAVGVAISACGSPSDDVIDSSGPPTDIPASSDSPGSTHVGVAHPHGKKNDTGSSASDGTGGSDDSDAGTVGSGDSDAGTVSGGDDSGASGAGADAGGGGGGDSDAGASGGGDTDGGGSGGNTGSDAGSTGSGDTSDGGGGSGDTNDGGSSQTGAPMLNLSSISCTDSGTVDVHFVLLFAGSATPGDLSGTYNGGSFRSATPATCGTTTCSCPRATSTSRAQK